MIYLNIYRVLQRTAISTNIKVRSMTLQGSILAYHGLKTKTPYYIALLRPSGKT